MVASGYHDWLFRRVVVDALTTDADGALTTTLYRPTDQLWLRYEFVGLVYDQRDGVLVGDGSARTPLVRVVLPPQHLAEAAIGVSDTPGTAPLPGRPAGSSRLVFEVEPPLPFTAEHLLGLSVLATVGPDGPTDSTMLEIPTALELYPLDAAAHADRAPVTHGDVTQLHRTRITKRDGGPVPLDARANTSGTDVDGRIPDSDQRDELVDRSSTRNPALARRLRLSAFGADADVEGSWSDLSWVQQIRGGRDEFVQLTRRGVVLPFGHPASWVESLVREWQVDTDGGVVAVLVARTMIVLEEATVELQPDQQPAAGRSMPFRRITLEGDGSVLATKDAIPGISTADAWIVRRNHPTLPANVWASYTATDVLAESAASAPNPPVSFSLPVVFVTGDAAASASSSALFTTLRQFYADPANSLYRSRPLAADVAWAAERDPGSGLTTTWVTQIEFGLDVAPSGSPLPVAPIVTGAVVRKPALESPALPPSQWQMEVRFPETWLDHGDDPAHNPTGAFLELVESKVFELGAEARAALTPDFVAELLDQSPLGIGPVLELVGDVFAWDPATVFDDGAQILRGILLREIAKVVDDISTAVPGVDIPGLTVDADTDNGVLRTTVEWCPDEINDVEAAGFITNDDTELCVTLMTEVGLGTAAADDADGSVTVVEGSATATFVVADFTLVVPPILGLVELDVTELRAEQPSDGATEFSLDVDGWRLGGALAFLEPLVSFLSPAAKAFDIEISSSAIRTSLEIPIPKLSFGVLEIGGGMIGLAGEFPFSGPGVPTVGFQLGSPSSPITLQIMQFSGEFSCALDFSTEGLERIAIRARASAMLVTIDIEVAKAYCGVSIEARFELADGLVSFTGLAELSAHFSVGGVINATLTLQASVDYSEAAQTVTLAGRILWSVTALFTFNGEVKLGSIEFALGGSSTGGGGGTSFRSASGTVGVGAGGTDFADQHELASWTEYVHKFAA